jgi:hypothetical protein
MRRLFGKKQDRRGEDFAAVMDLQAGQTELAPGLRNLYSPASNVKTHVRDIADVLGEEQVLSAEQLESLRNEQQRGHVDLEKYLQKLGISKDDILRSKARLYGFEFQKISPGDVDKAAFDKLELNYIRTNLVLRLQFETAY